ncbi:MAG TPA: zinc-binding dehydrogenase [Povalibacter sp.]
MQPGDHVVLSFAYCGHCHRCQDDRVAYCQHAPRLNFGGVSVDGSALLTDENGSGIAAQFLGQSSFATHVLVNESSVVRIDHDVPLELMGSLGCGMQTGAGTVLNVLQLRPGTSMAILGAGSVGLAALMAARIAGCGTLIAVDINQSRLRLAQELGADVCIHAASTIG